MKLYIDGGCFGNEQKDISKRKMVIAVAQYHEGVFLLLVEKIEEGGSNNIAELLAAKEAIEWAVAHHVSEVDLFTDSKVVCDWIKNERAIPAKRLKKMNDGDRVEHLRGIVFANKEILKSFTITQIPRSENKVGQYLERTYSI